MFELSAQVGFEWFARIGSKVIGSIYIFNLVPTFSIFFLRFRLRKVLYRIFYPLDSIPILTKMAILLELYIMK